MSLQAWALRIFIGKNVEKRFIKGKEEHKNPLESFKKQHYSWRKKRRQGTPKIQLSNFKHQLGI